MSAQNPNAETTNAVIATDGFDAAAQDPTASPIRGMNYKFKDGGYYNFDDEIEVRDKAYVVLDRRDGWQKLAKDTPPEYLMQEPGKPRPPQPLVDAKDWPLDFNGKPAHPWKWTHYLRLLEETSGEFITFWTNTTGGNIAVGQLSDQVFEMRRLRPGAVPVVALESRDMPTQYKSTKPRPHFQILRWKMRGDVEPQQLLAKPPQEQLTVVEGPTLKEQMGGDEVPYNDPVPEALGGSDMPKTTAPAVQQPAVQKPAINKKTGAQKIPGARR